MLISGGWGADILRLAGGDWGRGRVPLWHCGFEGLRLGVVAEEFVVEKATDALFLDGKGFHSELHAIKGSRFPNIIDREVVGAFRGDGRLFALARRRSKLKSDFIGNIIGNLDNVSNTLYTH
jgi:hypothetical protein